MTSRHALDGEGLAGIRARLFDADGEDRDVDPRDPDLAEIDERWLLWVDVDLDAGADLDTVAQRLSLGRAERAHLEADSGRARMVHSAASIHLTLEAVEPSSDEDPRSDLIRREIDLVARPGIVVSVHRGRVAALERFVAEIEGDTALGAQRAADLLSSLADEVIAGYHDVVERIGEEIDRLDELALRGRSSEVVLSEIVRIRRRIGLVRSMIGPHRAALTALGRPEVGLDEKTGVGQPWPGLVDRVEGVIAAVDSLRDALIGTYDIHMARAAQHANDVMKVLTVISAVLLPAVVVAGIMGMNFQLPFFDDTRNFWVVLVAMATFAGLIVLTARWRHWI